MKPVSEEVTGHVQAAVDVLTERLQGTLIYHSLPRLTLASDPNESHSSWFRRSVRRDELETINKIFVSEYMKSHASVDSCLIASHLKHLIKNISYGLIPMAFQDIMISLISTILF